MFDYDLLLRSLRLDLGEPHKEYSGNGSVQQTRQNFIRASLVDSFYKKLAPGGKKNVNADRRALKKFVNVNEAVSLRPPEVAFDDYLLDYFREEMHQVLGSRRFDNSDQFDFSFANIADHIECGPGKASDMAIGSFYEKHFHGPLSYSHPGLLALYRAAVFRHPVWAAAEWQRHQEFGEVTAKASKMFFAPKNVEESRTCATEAGVNMMFQKGILRLLEGRLLESSIDLSKQAKLNAKLALKGSLDDSNVTADQESASDCVSLQLIHEYCPQPLKGWLLSTRASHVRLPDGSELELKMLSTMGNGYTFPLQTAIFTCVVRTAYKLKGEHLPKGDAKPWGVFGDDIIVPKYLWPSVSRLLYLLGFKVNTKKTFESGSFRESCGVDAICGTNCRGVYIKSLESAPEIYSAINRLNRWSARHGILLTNTVGTLMKALRRQDRNRLVPCHLDDQAGVHAPYVYVSGPTCRPLFRKVSQRIVEVDSSEYLGYNWALYIGILNGAVKRQDYAILQIPYEVPLKYFIPRPEKPGGSWRRYFARPYMPFYWDWAGVVESDDARLDPCWQAVVGINCDLQFSMG